MTKKRLHLLSGRAHLPLAEEIADLLGEDGWDEPQDVLVLTGDTPLLRPATIAALVGHHRASDAACTVLTARLD
ncbi:MAG TPA: hypothetical protein VGE43_04205, partial [Acidimicrobiales bacterium]